MTSVLLGLRFLLELCLLAAAAIAAAALFDQPAAAVLAAIVSVVVVATVWGLLLSPRRRVDAPLWLRVLVELALFALAGAGLAAAGHGVWGVLLVATEVVVVSSLGLRGQMPGQDPGVAR